MEIPDFHHRGRLQTLFKLTDPDTEIVSCKVKNVGADKGKFHPPKNDLSGIPPVIQGFPEAPTPARRPVLESPNLKIDPRVSKIRFFFQSEKVVRPQC